MRFTCANISERRILVSIFSVTRNSLCEFHTLDWLCEGDGDVVGVVTPLVRGVAQVLHGDQVVELRVQLAVQEVEGKEEDREGQVEVEEEKRFKEKRT